jgi:hypothetical protein
MAEPLEVNLGSYVIMLDGKVVEIMHKSGIDLRIHVNHIAVKAEPMEEGAGMDMHVGVEQGGKIQQGVRFKVPADRQAEVIALFEKAQELRED